MEWDRLGTPPDRARLVERNVELKGKLVARGKALTGIGDGHHTAFKHVGTFDECQNGFCVGLKDILDKTKP